MSWPWFYNHLNNFGEHFNFSSVFLQDQNLSTVLCPLWLILLCLFGRTLSNKECVSKNQNLLIMSTCLKVMQCHLIHLSKHSYQIVNRWVFIGKFYSFFIHWKTNKINSTIPYCGRQNNGPPNIYMSYFSVYVNV